ncbi:MAG: phage protein [Magnetococcales bacterium]|nr:phage protein [Magnetococcales bacterium]HIJ82645.1 BrnT family toxin [Magnetococcales bacterium]
MKVIHDPAKDIINREKHGLSLAEAAHLDWDKVLVWEDTRCDYGEARQVAPAVLGTRVHAVVFVDRTDGRRIISLRKANVKEVMRYVEEFKNED